MRTAFLVVASALLIAGAPAQAQMKDAGFTLEQVLSPAFPYGLVSAKRADRVAWMESQRGLRNVFTAAAPDFERKQLTATMTDDAVDLASLQLSEDGSVALFVRGHTANFKGQIGNQSWDPRGGHREIWAASTTGSRPAWRVVELLPEDPAARVGGGGGGGGAGAFQISPDGKWVLYVRGGQIYRAAVDPGNADPVTIDEAAPLFVTLGVNSAPVWSPDGKKIAFVTGRYDQRQYFPTQGQAITHSFIAVYDMDSRAVDYLAPSVDRDTNPVWSADGKKVAFARRPGLPFGHFATAPLKSIARDDVPAGFLDSKFEGGSTLMLMVADVATGEATELWRNAPNDRMFAQSSGLEWSGGHLVMRVSEGSWPHLYSLSITEPSKGPIPLTPGDGAVEASTTTSDGKWLYFTSNIGDLDRRHLWRTPLAGGAPEQLTKGALIETQLAVTGSGKYVVAQQSGPKQPTTMALFAPTGGTGKLIGPLPPAEFPAAKHVVPTTVEITAADGVKSHIIMFLPTDLKAGEKRPTLLYNHGGGGRSVLGYPDQSNGYYHITYALIQYFVNQGYIVGAVNYRGDPLYGPAFNDPTEYGAEGVSEYRDVLAAGLYLKSRPDVDAERLGVWGLSYGGWLTGEALSRNSDIFKSGSIHAGVQLRSTSLDPNDLGYQSSPAFNVEKWTSPTLVFHGDDDRSVEFSQTVGLTSLLRARGVPHKIVVFPDETHYYMRYSLWLKEYHMLDQWFKDTLLEKRTDTAYRGEGR